VGEAPTMRNSSPSKLALWMEYSFAGLDKELKGGFMPLPIDPFVNGACVCRGGKRALFTQY
jgi:hypothetical protein